MNKITVILIVVFVCLSSIAYGANINSEKTNITKVVGLELALTKVKNEQAKASIQSNIERLQNLSNKVEVTTINGEEVVTAEKRAKFLGIFPFQYRNTFRINDDGTLTRKPQFLDSLVTEGKIEL